MAKWQTRLSKELWTIGLSHHRHRCCTPITPISAHMSRSQLRFCIHRRQMRWIKGPTLADGLLSEGVGEAVRISANFDNGR